MARYCERFGEKVRDLLAVRAWSIQEATRRTKGNVSFATIRGMTLNIIPGTDLIVEFAEAMGETPDERAALADELLHLAEKRVRYHAPASVMPGLLTGLRPVAGSPVTA